MNAIVDVPWSHASRAVAVRTAELRVQIPRLAALARDDTDLLRSLGMTGDAPLARDDSWLAALARDDERVASLARDDGGPTHAPRPTPNSSLLTLIAAS